MKSLTELGTALRKRAVSARELVVSALQEAEAQAHLHPFITLTAEAALAEGQERDRELARGEDRGPLHGIPVAHKDCLFTQGVRTTWGSPLFRDFVPEQDAAVVRRLRAAGAISIGKTNLHELTYGMTSNNPHFGAVGNPHDAERVAGGSSGGSGVVVATGIVALATGTDTGGSIRIPASFCGVVGFKPTFDRVSREGCFPLAFTLDHVGPMTSNVADAATAFGVMAGAEVALPKLDPAGLRIGVPEEYFFDHAVPAVREAVEKAADRAARHGAHVRRVRLPDVNALNVVGRVVQLSEAAAVFARYAGRRGDFGADVMALVDQGRMIPATEYLNAQRVRTMLVAEFARIWDSLDLVLTPTTPMPAPRIGEQSLELPGGVTGVRMAGTSLTRPINVLGWPALSIPCGSCKGLPVGLQLIAAPHRDEFLLAAGIQFESWLR